MRLKENTFVYKFLKTLNQYKGMRLSFYKNKAKNVLTILVAFETSIIIDAQEVATCMGTSCTLVNISTG